MHLKITHRLNRPVNYLRAAKQYAVHIQNDAVYGTPKFQMHFHAARNWGWWTRRRPMHIKPPQRRLIRHRIVAMGAPMYLVVYINFRPSARCFRLRRIAFGK